MPLKDGNANNQTQSLKNGELRNGIPAERRQLEKGRILRRSADAPLRNASVYSKFSTRIITGLPLMTGSLAIWLNAFFTAPLVA